MRRIYFIIAMLVITSTAYISCQKETQEDIDTIGKSSGTFKASIDGINWEAAEDKQTASIFEKRLYIKGLGNDGKMLNIIVNGDTAGTYYVARKKVDGVILYTPEYRKPDVSYITGSSTDTTVAYSRVVITAVDTVKKNVSGTFEGVALMNVDGTRARITKGSFNLRYIKGEKPVMPGIPIGPGNPTNPGSGTDTSHPTNPGNPVTSVPDNTFKATIAGKAWSSTNSTTQSDDKKIILTGLYKQELKTIAITLPKEAAVGEHALNDNEGYVVTYVDASNLSSTKYYNGESGKIKIISHDIANKKISGTFSFVGKNEIGGSSTVNVTDGQFNLGYK